MRSDACSRIFLPRFFLTYAQFGQVQNGEGFPSGEPVPRKRMFIDTVTIEFPTLPFEIPHQTHRQFLLNRLHHIILNPVCIFVDHQVYEL